MRKEQKTSRPAPQGGGTGTAASRQAARRKRRIRRRIIRISIVLTVFLLLVLLVALLVLRISGKVAQQNGTASSVMAVKAIEVEGDTRYSDEEIIKASGIYVGESLLVVNKVQAHNAILRQFPYLDYVDVGNSSFSTILIQVRETQVMAVAETPSGYMVVGENNHALEQISEEALPADVVRIKGAALLQEKIGEELLDERSLHVTRTLLQAAELYEMADLTAIDMTEKTNIRLMWKGQIQVILGNESNLALQVKALTGILPTLLGNNGETATGRLDMSSYADGDASNDRAVFSPMTLEELTAPPEPEEPTSGDEEPDSTTSGADTAATTDTTVDSTSTTAATE